MAAPKSIHKPHQVKEEKSPATDIQTQIQALAYELWMHRGAPIGSPEEDWYEAENRLTRGENASQQGKDARPQT